MEKLLRTLPVVASFCRRLDLEGIVDRTCPIWEVATLTHGQVSCALVANRLTSPTPLRRVEVGGGVGGRRDVRHHGRGAERRPHRPCPGCNRAQAPPAGRAGRRAQAIAAFGLEVARLHWDMTSVSLSGAYEEPEDGFIAPRFRHRKDRRPDLRQVPTGLAVTGDGGVPVFHRAYNGGAGEVAQVARGDARAAPAGRTAPVAAGGRLQAGLLRNLRGSMAAGVDFVAPGVQDLRGCRGAGRSGPCRGHVDDLAERDAGKDPARRSSYRVVEDT